MTHAPHYIHYSHLLKRWYCYSYYIFLEAIANLLFGRPLHSSKTLLQSLVLTCESKIYQRYREPKVYFYTILYISKVNEKILNSYHAIFPYKLFQMNLIQLWLRASLHLLLFPNNSLNPSVHVASAKQASISSTDSAIWNPCFKVLLKVYMKYISCYVNTQPALAVQHVKLKCAFKF